MPVRLCCLLLLLGWGAAQALQAQSQPGQVTFLTTREGLAQDNVNAILQDRKGFMWFGTQEGLNRFNGYTFTLYQNEPNKPNTLSHNYIHTLFEDQQGRLWIGSDDGGLSLFDAARETFTNYTHSPGKPTSLAHNKVMAIVQDARGYLWVGTAGGGLDRFDPAQKTFTHFTHQPANPNSLSENWVSSLFMDRSGIIWVGTEHRGLDRLDPATNTFTHYTHNPTDPHSLSHNNVAACYEDTQGQFWVGTLGGGLNRLDRTSGTFTHYQHATTRPHQLSHNNVTAISEDNQHTLWIGTQNGGINRLHPDGTFTYLTDQPGTNQGLNNGSIYCLYRDPVGTMWVGTYSGGVNKVDALPPKFTLYQRSPQTGYQLTHSNILTVRVDHQGDWWLGTDGGGINVLPKGQSIFKAYHYPGPNASADPRNYVITIYEDRRKRIWTGNFKGGLTLFNRTRKRFEPKGNFSPLSVSAILEASDGLLWLGTYEQGLIRYNTASGANTRFDAHPDQAGQLNYPTITALWEDRRGNIWVATDGGGINVYNPATNRFTPYVRNPGKPGSLPDNQVNALYESKSGQLWVGTNSGLSRFDPLTQTFTTFRRMNGLANEAVKGILEDKRGTLWVSTNKGLSSFQPTSGRFRTYTASDGLQENSFNRMACYAGEDGQLFFGGVGGLNTFYPDRLRDNPVIPPVYITGFQLFNQPVRVQDSPSVLHRSISETRDITLSYQQSVFSFDFAALNYTLPARNQYAYKLEGFDADWVQTGTKRTVSYTHLDPGDYVFRVRGSNNDGVWNQRGTFIRLHITPPLWQTAWFKSLLGLLTLGVLYGSYRLRVQQISRQQVYLQQQVQNRTRQVLEQQQTMADQALQVDLLQAKLDQQLARQELRESEQRFRELAENVDELFWIRDVAAGGISYINPVFETFTGIPVEEVYRDPMTFFSAVIEEDKPLIEAASQSQDRNATFQFRIRHRMGQQRWLTVRIFSIFDEQGQLMRRIGVATDTTSLIEKGQILEESLRKERALTALQSQFITTASHEFRTPLTAISSSVELLQYYLGQLPAHPVLPAMARHMTAIFTKIQSLNTLIGDTLTISKLDEGRIKVNWQPLEVVDFCQTLLETTFGERTDQRRVELTVHGEAKPVETDPNLLDHILVNLLSNAFKFSTHNPGLTIRFDAVHLELAVSDRGIGIPADELSQIFGKFFRARNAGAFQGTGLGLVICREYASLLGGDLSVSSEQGVGTQFTLRLPFQKTSLPGES